MSKTTLRVPYFFPDGQQCQGTVVLDQEILFYLNDRGWYEFATYKPMKPLWPSRFGDDIVAADDSVERHTIRRVGISLPTNSICLLITNKKSAKAFKALLQERSGKKPRQRKRNDRFRDQYMQRW